MKWVSEHSNFHYIPVLSEPDAKWEGRTGWVHDSVVADHADLNPFEIYMSGPPPMINAGKEAFLAHNLAEEHLYSDSFEYGAAAGGK